MLLCLVVNWPVFAIYFQIRDTNRWLRLYRGRSVDVVDSTPVRVWEPAEPEMIGRRQVTVDVVHYQHDVTHGHYTGSEIGP